MKLMDIITAPWAITPGMLLEIRAIYATHLRGEKIDIAGVEARLGRALNNTAETMQVVNGVAIIQANGPVAKRMNLFTEVSGGVSTEILASQIDTAMADPNIKGVVLSIDSPGGTVDGTFELAAHIHSLRGSKPIVTYADGLVASAAYAIAAATDAIYISGPAAHVGSIGVVAAHVDYSAAEQKDGVKTTEIYAGKYKRIASSYEPLTADGRASIQDAVDYLYSVFVNQVAEFRGVAVSTVLENMADGKIFIGQQAIDAGLVDGSSTLQNIVDALSQGQLPTTSLLAGAAKTETSLAHVVAAVIQTEIDQHDFLLIHAQTEDSEMSEITLALITEKHPDIAAALRAQGATTELARVQSVMAQGMPGHDKLINQLAFDGKTTGPEAAVQILNAERNARGNVLADLRADAPKPVQHATEQDAPTPAGADDKAEAKWASSAELQAEFGGKFTRYLAFLKSKKAA